MISDLLPLLARGGVDDPTPEELADILWLAQRVLAQGRAPVRAEGQAEVRSDSTPEAAPAPTPPTERPTGPTPQDVEPHRRRHEVSAPAEALDVHVSTGTPEPLGTDIPTGTSVEVPAAASLPNTLALARALKPLARKVPSRTVFELDEEATVTRLVDEHILLPVLRPEPTRWLSLALVVDCGPSMALWQDEVHEVQHDVVRLGAFRDIRRWNLLPSRDGTAVGLRPHPATHRPARRPREVVDPAGDQLILVLSDTVGAMWRTGAAHRLLADWARHSQVAVVHLLPAALWHRVGMAPGPTLMHIPQPGLPNSQWKVADPEHPHASGALPGVPVPVVELEPRSLRGWAEMTARTGRWTRSSALLLPGAGTAAPPRPFTRPVPAGGEDAIRRFRASSSPAAWRLAGLLSARTTVTVPVARLIQRALLRDSSRGDLAEVFLGGILRRGAGSEETGADGPLWFEFQPQVREALLGAQYRDDVEAVQDLVRAQVTAYLKPRYGTARSVKGAAAGAGQRNAEVPAEGEAIATASRADVVRMGGSVAPAREEDEARPLSEADVSRTVLVSHAGADRAWAEWVGWHLETAGYKAVLDLWQPESVEDLVQWANTAFQRASAVVALFSAAYLRRRPWSAADAAAVFGAGRPHIPLALEDLSHLGIPAALAVRVGGALHRLDESAATAVLLAAVDDLPHDDVRVPPAELPAPGQPRFPKALPRVWGNVPPPNPHFAGQEEVLDQVRRNLAGSNGFGPVVLHGIVGVGKSQIALEYVHRFASQYDAIWWIDLRTDQLAFEYATLARQLGEDWPEERIGAEPETMLRHLRSRDRWLVVLDNADNPLGMAPWVPHGGGHVLITSRSSAWQSLARGIPVRTIARGTSCRYLKDRVPHLTDHQANAIADVLGDLPLALAQTAGVLVSVEGMSAQRYLALFHEDPTRLLGQGTAAAGGKSLVGILDSVTTELTGADASEAQLLRLASYFGPDPIPLDWLRTSDGGRWSPFASLVSRGLADVDDQALQLHRLTRAFVHTRTSESDSAALRSKVVAILADACPGDPDDPCTWPQWAVLHSHQTGRPLGDGAHEFGLFATLIDSVRYLLRAGRAKKAVDMCAEFYRRWASAFGTEHPDTLTWAAYLARATTMGGDCEEGRRLHEQVREERTRVLGEDHRDTLTATHDLANALLALGQYAKSRRLHNDTLRRRRRVLGEDHPETLASANGLANALRGLGKQPEARRIHDDTLQRRRRVLGEDHPDTLTSASHLANALRGLGELHEARRLHGEVLEMRRRKLGEFHPATLASAHHLGVTLYRLQRHQEAKTLLTDTLVRCRDVLGTDHPSTVSTRKALVATLVAMGRRDEVNELLIPRASLWADSGH